MARSVYCNFHSVLIVWVILGVIQGYSLRRLEDQRTVENKFSEPEAILSNSNETQARDRESPNVYYESHIKLPDVSAHRNIESDGRIIFPSDLPYIVPQNYTPPPASICANTTFCENPPHYPNDLIRNAIKSRDDLKHFAAIDTVPVIAQRIDVDNDVPLCMYQDRVIYPKSAESKDKEWLYIVNEKDFPQGVRIEECMTENTACRLIEGFSEGYTTSCKQKYVYRQLAAVSSNGILNKNYFRFAASCCCHVKFTGSAAARIGAFGGGGKANLQSPVPRIISSRVSGIEKK